MKLVIAVTGASGAIYPQRLLAHLARLGRTDRIAVVMSRHGEEVAREELGPGGLVLPAGVDRCDDGAMTAPFVSGSSVWDAMAVIPCSMGTLGRIAAGLSDTVITRAADVFLKERRPLVLVPRETPLHRTHLRNMLLAADAGAVVLPASPSFYSQPGTVEQLVDTVLFRVLRHLGIPAPDAPCWEGPRAGAEAGAGGALR